MSLLWKTAVDHPIYEVGDTSEWGEVHPDYHVTRYTSGDKVHPESLGLKHVGEGWEGKRFQAGPSGTEAHVNVPTHTLRATQDYVYAPHVHNLASVPQAEFHKTQEWDPVSVYRMKDGTHAITEGHHRGAASIVRGDSHLRVHLDGVEV